MIRLHVSPKLCSGCRSCEMACSYAHAEVEARVAGGLGGLRPGLPRVRVAATGTGAFVPILCFQCDEARCVGSCKYGALERSPRTGAIEVDEGRCTLCGVCAAACPFGNMERELSRRAMVKCDLCKGEPACAKFCPTGALRGASVPR
ncbi:MAG: 4Fe-4S dicluster domain-containing protein [Candidatus Wallbacteria bacterium]|nr:4Fe-4S dicluster domain-containing protein [Candidatus Wallbacteria bacterium]